VAELSPPVQAKLLRVLQEGRVLAVGEEREEAVDVRIVAATNADLAQMVAAGTFRADLYHRLNVLSVRVPPLRERPGDVPELVRHFVRKHRHLHPEVVDVHPEFLEAVGHLQLPGNARELENLVRWALVQHDGAAPLGLRDLPVDVVRDVVRHCRAADIGSEAPGLVAPPSGDAGRDWNLARTLRASSEASWRLRSPPRTAIRRRRPVSSASRHAASTRSCGATAWPDGRNGPSGRSDPGGSAWTVSAPPLDIASANESRGPSRTCEPRRPPTPWHGPCCESARCAWT